MKYFTSGLIILGTIFIFIGLGGESYINHPSPYEINWNWIIEGVVLIIAVFIFLIYDTYKKIKLLSPEHIKMCPKCKVVYKNIKNNHTHCSSCGIKLEKFDDFL